MTSPSRIVSIDTSSWTDPLPAGNDPAELVAELERGKVLFFPRLGFELSDAELALLNPALVDPKRKNISLNADTGKLTGVVVEDERKAAIAALVKRYHAATQQLLGQLAPAYLPHLYKPTTSLRLHAIGTWKNSWRKDDTRLHVDAFPSRPTGNQRILRVFNNINPHGKTRSWRVGEDFETLAGRFLPTIPPFKPALASLMHKLHITKTRRSHYDHLMLHLHDNMKADLQYQQTGAQEAFEFPSGTTWICFSDQAPHAAMAGQFMLEQTYMMPVDAMQQPALSPQHVLQRLAGIHAG